MAFEDILYEKRDGIATITINRPEVLNAFRAETVEEMLQAMRDAEEDRDIGVIVLAGAGDRAFCAGGDNSARGSPESGGYGGRGLVGLPIEELHSAIRDSRKPVIAKVQGYAIGGGNVLATVCDLTIASEKAQFGQVGPRVGSVDPGWGTAYLSRLVGEKRAREIWFLCRRYTAAEAYAMGLVNKVVPGRAARRRNRGVVPRDPGAVADRDRDRQALVQRRQREHPRHRRARLRVAGAVLRERGIEGGNAGLSRKAPPRFPRQAQALTGEFPGDISSSWRRIGAT